MTAKTFTFILIGLLVFSPAALLAFPADEPLQSAVQESEARAIFKELRCVVCSGESVAESSSEVAADIRRAVRELVAAGKSRDEVVEFLVSRYGETVLMSPRLKPSTFLLWFGPMILSFVGIAVVFSYFSSARIHKS